MYSPPGSLTIAYPPSPMTTEQKRNNIFRAADILKQTDRGTKALKELKRALFGGLVGLDSV